MHEPMRCGPASAYHMSGNGNMPPREATVVYIPGETNGEQRQYRYLKKGAACEVRMMSAPIHSAGVPSVLWIWLVTSGSGRTRMRMIAPGRQYYAAAAIIGHRGPPGTSHRRTEMISTASCC